MVGGLENDSSYVVQYFDSVIWGIARVRSVNNKIYVFLSIVWLIIFAGHCWAQDNVPAVTSTGAADSAAQQTTAGETIQPAHVHAEQLSAEPSVAPSLPSLAAFRTLDQETELLVKEVLDLSSDLAIIQEEEDNPANFQLLVLVTLDPTKLFTLDYVQLEVDNEVVAAYQYSESDFQALKRGGGPRLYVANLPAGMHEVFATMVGRIPRDPDYKSEVSYKFISGVARTVLELNVSSKSKGFPVLGVKEWN